MMKHTYPYSFLLIALFAFFLWSCADDAGMDDAAGEYKADGYSLLDSEGGGSGGEVGQGGGQTEIESGQITAGEWNDLDNWAFWQELYQVEDFKDMHTYWGYDLDPRIMVHIENSGGADLPGIQATLINDQGAVIWESVSDQNGMLNLWPGAYDLTDLEIEIAGNKYAATGMSSGIVEVTLDQAAPTLSQIEVAFIVDATGSMSDELEYLKVELMDVLDSVEQQSSVSVISGSVFYRDEGDEYVTRYSDFSGEVATTVNFIKNQQAAGGGDWPEAVHTALDKTINTLQWSTGTNPKLAFMLLDAPPHYDDQVLSEIHQLIKTYSEKGVKLIPVASSGIDKQTEFLLRYFAIATNGTYVFITNHSGIGNEHIEPSVGEYQVEYLNQLIARLILQEVSE